MKNPAFFLLFCMLLVFNNANSQDLYDGGSRFINGFARVVKGADYFYIDSLGHYAFDRIPDIDRYSTVTAPTAADGPGKENSRIAAAFCIVYRKNKVGAIQPGGKWLLQPIYDSIDTQDPAEWIIKKDNKKSLFNARGFLLPFLFEEVFNMDNRFFCVKQREQWGVYDRESEKLVVPCRYEDMDYCFRCESKGDYVFAALNGRWGIINFNNEVLLPFEYEHRHINMRSDEWVMSFYKNDQPLTINLKTKKVDSSGVQDIPENGIDYMTDGFARIKKGDKYGMQNAQGHVVLDIQYDYLRYDTTELPKPLVLLHKNGRYGIADTTGNVILQPVYDNDFTLFDNRFLKTRKDGKQLLFDIKGKKILPNTYDEIEAWYPDGTDTGLLLKLTNKKLLGFYNPGTGKLTEPQFSYLYNFFDDNPDWIKAGQNKKEGIVDRNGHVIVSFIYDNVQTLPDNKNLLRVGLGTQYGLYDIHKQALVAPIQYSEISAVQNSNFFFVQQDGGTGEGLLDAQGNVICPMQAYQRLDETDTAARFFVITRKDTTTSKISYSILNAATRQIVPLPYDTVAIGGYDDRLGVHVGKDQYALYDIVKGKIVQGAYTKNGGPQLVYPYRNKALIIQNGKIGIIKSDGSSEIPPSYEMITPLTDSILQFVVKDKTGALHYGFGDNSGNMIIPVQYTYLPAYKNDYLRDGMLLLLMNDGRGGLIKGYASIDGKIVIPVQYKEIVPADKNLGYLVKGAKGFGIINRSGKTILPAVFDNILLDDQSNYLTTVAFTLPVAAKKDARWHYYDTEGHQLPVSFNSTMNFVPPYEHNSEEKDAGNLAASASITQPERSEEMGVAEQKAIIEEDGEKETRIGAVNQTGIAAPPDTAPVEQNDYALIEVDKSAPDSGEQVFTSVENAPQFPGGRKALQQYLQQHLKVPQKALDAKVTGKIQVRFVVDKTGRVKDVIAGNDIGYGCAAAAEQVVSDMPHWTPGKQDGKPVAVRQTAMVIFEQIKNK